MTLDVGNDNKAIVPNNHPVPQKHQSTTRLLAGGKKFSKVDLSFDRKN